MTLLEPLLTSLHGLPPHATARVRLAADEPGRPGDGHRLLPVRVGADGAAVPLPSCGSAMLRGLAMATGLIVVPPGGDQVEHLPLPWWVVSPTHVAAAPSAGHGRC